MPFTWKINIKKNPKPPGLPAIFEFDLPTQDIQVGDQIIWSNNDTVAHFPVPSDGSFAFVSNQIAPNSTSSGFAPGNPGPIKYKCSLHNGEGGTIVVNPTPPPSSETE